MADYINLKKLTLDELAGVVSLYPWYGAARKEMCLRMSKIGGDSWGKSEYGTAALYVGARKYISDIYRMENVEDYSDKDIERILKSYIQESRNPVSEERPVRVVGGDYFSQTQYDNVKRTSDNVFSKFAFKARVESPEKTADFDVSDDFCTETLAQIYADQGYYEQAKRIYSKLLLKFPEKNTYFASLIGQIEQVENK